MVFDNWASIILVNLNIEKLPGWMNWRIALNFDEIYSHIQSYISDKKRKMYELFAKIYRGTWIYLKWLHTLFKTFFNPRINIFIGSLDSNSDFRVHPKYKAIKKSVTDFILGIILSVLFFKV